MDTQRLSSQGSGRDALASTRATGGMGVVGGISGMPWGAQLALGSMGLATYLGSAISNTAWSARHWTRSTAEAQPRSWPCSPSHPSRPPRHRS
jgi:hypothetical protein